MVTKKAGKCEEKRRRKDERAEKLRKNVERWTRLLGEAVGQYNYGRQGQRLGKFVEEFVEQYDEGAEGENDDRQLQ